MAKKFEIIRITGIAMGVGYKDQLPDGSGAYSQMVCGTLYETGDNKKDADESEKWANIICNALNKYHKEV